MSTSTQHFADPGHLHERRLHPRIFPKTLVYVACGAANGGMVLNASDAGLAISMAIAVDGESFSNLLVRMNGLPQGIETNGRIVWTNASRKRAGIQLINVTGTQREQICEWLAFEGIREVHLVPQQAPKVIAPVAPVFDESRYSLLQAFGGTTPESLGPVPSLLDQAPNLQEMPHQQTFSSQANAETQPAQDFTSASQDGFRDNEWDLADVTLVPRKKLSRTGLPASALIFLWIAIPCFGIGMLVGRRPLEQWLSRGDANGENVSQVVKPVSTPVNDGATWDPGAKVETSASTSSTQDAKLSRIHVDATNYVASDAAVAAPLPQETSAIFLNSLSTQEIRAAKKSSVAATAPSQTPAVTHSPANSDSTSHSSFVPAKPVAVPEPVVTASAAAATPIRKPDNSAATAVPDDQSANVKPVAPPTVARDDKNSTVAVAAAISTNSKAQQNYDERMPKTISVDSGLSLGSTAARSTLGNVQPAASTATAPSMAARSNSTPSASSLNSRAPNPAPAARPVSPSASPSIAPVLPQPPLHGVMRVARKNDESFVLKLPLESVSGDHNISIRMQRFVVVPKQSRWHRHGPIVKLTIGELLDHDTPAAMSAGLGEVITVRAFVDKNGAVEDLKPVSGRFALLPRVMRAVREWQFDRTLLDGKPVESEVNVTMEFGPAR